MPPRDSQPRVQSLAPPHNNLQFAEMLTTSLTTSLTTATRRDKRLVVYPLVLMALTLIEMRHPKMERHQCLQS
jgi:hypothetical protein